jgi:hypothetical protein
MESIFRAAYTKKPCETDGEGKGKSKIEYDTPGNAERGQHRGNTVTGECADAICHTVPDDTAADIFTGQESGLNIQNITPEHTLRKTVDKPDVFHWFDIRGKSDSEIAKRGNDHGEGDGIFWITVFGDKSIDELSCRVTEEVKRAYCARYGLLNAEILANRNQVSGIAKSSDISG